MEVLGSLCYVFQTVLQILNAYRIIRDKVYLELSQSKFTNQVLLLDYSRFLCGVQYLCDDYISPYENL